MPFFDQGFRYPSTGTQTSWEYPYKDKRLIAKENADAQAAAAALGGQSASPSVNTAVQRLLNPTAAPIAAMTPTANPQLSSAISGLLSPGAIPNYRTPAPTMNPQVSSAIFGLLTPGLVPDIARQSAEVAGGRGAIGSPAGGSTAVRMSEQNYLQRLGLANSLLSGEAERALPYQITPYQAAQLANQQGALNQQGYGLASQLLTAETARGGITPYQAAELQNQQTSLANQGLGLANQLLSGQQERTGLTPFQSASLANQSALTNLRYGLGGYGGYRGYGGYGYGYGGGTGRTGVGNVGGNYVSPYSPYRSTTYGGGLDTHGSLPGVNYGGLDYGGGGNGGSPSLDDMLRDLGIYGEDDTGAGTGQPPDFDWEMWQ